MPKFRERNTLLYRLAHWPIWIAVTFLAPGPLIFDLFAHGFDRRMAIWLAVVLLGTGIAGLRGRLPGVEPRPYIIQFVEDKPNPLYRLVCYTVAWNAILTFFALNLAGLIDAVLTGRWRLRQIYDYGYLPAAACVVLLGVLRRLPRAGYSTKGEARERAYFYRAVWTVAIPQAVLGVLWKLLPNTRPAAAIKLAVFGGLAATLGALASQGRLARTLPLTPRPTRADDDRPARQAAPSR